MAKLAENRVCDNCCKWLTCQLLRQQNQTSLLLYRRQSRFQNIKIFFKSFHDIEREIQTTNVLIHCAAGISRSATFVIAYLIMKKGMSYKQAFNHVKSRRPMIRPNPGFITVLESLEQKQ